MITNLGSFHVDRIKLWVLERESLPKIDDRRGMKYSVDIFTDLCENDSV